MNRRRTRWKGSERILGEAIQPLRHCVVITSRFLWTFDRKPVSSGRCRTASPIGPGASSTGCSSAFAPIVSALLDQHPGSLYMTGDAFAKAAGPKDRELFEIDGATPIETCWVPKGWGRRNRQADSVLLDGGPAWCGKRCR